MSEQSSPLYKRWYFWLGLLLFIGLCNNLTNDEDSSTGPETTSNQESSNTEQEPAPTSSQESSRFPIPGLYPVDVYGNLEDRGFTCEGPSSLVDLVKWDCTDENNRYSLEVEIVGYSASDVKSIEAWALSYTGIDASQLARPYFGFVATLPYDGASPQEARAWVEQNVGSKTSKTFGDVRYELFTSGSSGNARGLRLDHIDDSD